MRLLLFRPRGWASPLLLLLLLSYSLHQQAGAVKPEDCSWLLDDPPASTSFVHVINFHNRTAVARAAAAADAGPEAWYDPRPLHKCGVESMLRYADPGRLVVYWTDDYEPAEFEFLGTMGTQRSKLLICDASVGSWHQDTPFEHWNNTGKYTLNNLSNALRLALLWKLGGLYMDLDIILLDGSAFAQNANLMAVINNGHSWYDNAFLQFPARHHQLLWRLMVDFVANFDGSRYGFQGPRLLERVVKPCLAEGADFCASLLVGALGLIAPFPPEHSPHCFNSSAPAQGRAYYDNWRGCKLWAMHWYGSSWYNVHGSEGGGPACMMPKSLMHLVANSSCPLFLQSNPRLLCTVE